MGNNSLIKHLRMITNVVVVFLFAVVVVVVSAQVFSRFVINLSIRWADELSRFAFVWLVYIGGAVTIRDGRNVCFDLFLDSCKGKTWKLMFTIVTGISMLFLVLMTYFGVLVCNAELTEASPIMHWPMAVVCAAIPIGGVLMILEEVCYYLEHKNDRDGQIEGKEN
ncbi:MAG: TRAP transporter small permease [Clostridiales bacterium]|nr:TRAP transporter small permease [Clostridiales bacterium]